MEHKAKYYSLLTLFYMYDSISNFHFKMFCMTLMVVPRRAVSAETGEVSYSGRGSSTGQPLPSPLPPDCVLLCEVSGVCACCVCYVWSHGVKLRAAAGQQLPSP